MYNPISELWLVRASDAHSWVEAWIPGHGWTTFDPTPPDPNPPSFAWFSRLGLYLDAAETFWQQWVVGYDAGQQGSLADRVEQAARRAGIRWFDVADSDWDARTAAWFRRYGRGILAAGGLTFWIWLLAPAVARLVRVRRHVETGAARRGQRGGCHPALRTLAPHPEASRLSRAGVVYSGGVCGFLARAVRLPVAEFHGDVQRATLRRPCRRGAASFRPDEGLERRERRP